MWDASTSYDNNTDGCLRYKYAWSTVINHNYTVWTPDTNQQSEFEFRACSGATLEDMMGQMNKTTSPKLVLMEASGNNGENSNMRHRTMAAEKAILTLTRTLVVFLAIDTC